MDFLKQNKTPLLVGVLLLGALYVYSAYFTSPVSPVLSTSDADVTLSQNLLVTLQNLHTIKLDNSIFTDPAYQSLTDFGVVIPAEALGRRNPFQMLVGSTPGANGVNVNLPLTGH